jgi:hypothetical protein
MLSRIVGQDTLLRTAAGREGMSPGEGGSMGTIFLYDVEFIPYTNPPHRKDQFSESLKEFFRANHLDFLMSALGGMARTRGIVYRKEGEVSQQDRERVAGFIGQQPIFATARIGELEVETEATDYFREVTEWVFAVDNLTDADRAQAAAYDEHIRRWLRGAKGRGSSPL